jgi:hypothetical protein
MRVTPQESLISSHYKQPKFKFLRPKVFSTHRKFLRASALVELHKLKPSKFGLKSIVKLHVGAIFGPQKVENMP